MSKPQYILALPSWYPDRYEPFNGDFIQRQCRAYIQFREIVLIKVIAGEHSAIDITTTGTEFTLHEKLVYFRRSRVPFIGRSITVFRKWWLYYREIRQMLNAKGKPLAVHCFVVWPAGPVALLVKKIIRVPLLITEHWSIYQQDDTTAKPFHKGLRKWFFNLIFRNADYVFPVSASLLGDITKRYPVNTARIIPNVVRTDLFRPASNGTDMEEIRFLHVSVMGEVKNVEGILTVYSDWAKDKNNVKLTLVGPPSERVLQIMAKLTPEQSSKIKLTGEIGYREVAEQMQQHHALVLFSWVESLPCVMLEALCTGMPVISTNVGGIPEVINDTNGILIPAGDTQALLQAFDSFALNKNNFNRAAISTAAIQTYSYSAVATMQENVYREIALTSSRENYLATNE